MSTPAISTAPHFGTNIRLHPDPNINTTTPRESKIRQAMTERLSQIQARLAASQDILQPLSAEEVLPEHRNLLLNRVIFGEDKLAYLALKALKIEVGGESPAGLSRQEEVGISQRLGQAMERHLEKTTLDVYI